MVRIDWFQYVYDRVWFGWYIHSVTSDDVIIGRYFRFPISKLWEMDKYVNDDWGRARWKRSVHPHDRWWPARIYGDGPPMWWLKLHGVKPEYDPEHYEEFFGND